MSSSQQSSPSELAQDSETKSDKENKRAGSLLIVILLSILAFPILFPCLRVVLPLLNRCQDVIPYRKDVNVAPLMDLVIPADSDLSQWTNSEAGLQSIGGNGVFTNVERFPSVADAYEMFDFECKDDHYTSRVKYNGQESHQYCISSIKTVRNDPEGLCLPEGSYSSYVIIQKGDVIIEIYEDSGDKNSTEKDAVIERLALEIDQAIGK